GYRPSTLLGRIIGVCCPLDSPDRTRQTFRSPLPVASERCLRGPTVCSRVASNRLTDWRKCSDQRTRVGAMGRRRSQTRCGSDCRRLACRSGGAAWQWPADRVAQCSTSSARSRRCYLMSKDNDDHRIVCKLDELLELRDMTLAELARRVDVSVVNLSVLKNNRGRAIRFTTLTRLCEELQ